MILCDASPLIALVVPNQREQHLLCATTLAKMRETLITTWACFGEAMHLVGAKRRFDRQLVLWEYVDRGILEIHELTGQDIQRTQALMRQYSSTPMDLGDATLVVAAETLGIHRVFTLDPDFYVYQIHGKTPFEVIPSLR
ncbi:MAG: PIN domain-containing protein [Armatimonadetes bacterium]|nr:PIN domain-containing protein [Armatimonadota bacterium]